MVKCGGEPLGEASCGFERNEKLAEDVLGGTRSHVSNFVVVVVEGVVQSKKGRDMRSFGVG